ncbi:MAG: hypothetical protein AMJ75_08940 [Phycisphaerae bacterium SM1_79]|nr:MAG: hypothetical protein AMJ75_08940 [Phycisphaerae bacterium SM1_79]
MFGIVIILLTTASCSSDSVAQVPQFLPGKQVGTVQTELIREASGIVASRKNPKVLWLHNDSGDSARVYAINFDGRLLGIYRIKEAHCRDWEDIAIGPGPEPEQDYLYIGDIGDNGAEHKSITVYRVPEPKVDPNGALAQMQVGPANSIELVYPDGPRDAETLMVDPLNGDIYVITKRELLSKVYRAPYPQSTKQRTTMDQVATLPWGLAVGGDISPNGKLVIVRGYFNASMWVRPDGEELWRAFMRKQLRLDLMEEPKGEAICFDASGGGYFTVSEMVHPPIYYFGRSVVSDKSND